jgi:hypothetical protein
LVDRGKIRRVPRSGAAGFSLQRRDQNKLNSKSFDTIDLTTDVTESQFPAVGTAI